MIELLDRKSTPLFVYLLIFLVALALVLRGIAKWRKTNSSSDESLSPKEEEEGPNYMPVGKQNLLLQQQKIITAPSHLTPEKIMLETTTYISPTDAIQTAENLFHQGGFYPGKERGKPFFVGPFGEIFTISQEKETIRIEYADDYNLAVEGSFGLFASYPLSLGDRLLPSIAEDVKEYAENV